MEKKVIFHQCYTYVGYEFVVLRNYERTLQSATGCKDSTIKHYRMLRSCYTTLYSTIAHYGVLWNASRRYKALQR